MGCGSYDDHRYEELDNYVFDVARDVLSVERPKLAWSKWDDYDNQYLAYQKQIRNKVTECEPLRWEFRSCLKAAHNVGNDK